MREPEGVDFAPWGLPFRDRKTMEYTPSPLHLVPKGRPQGVFHGFAHVKNVVPPQTP